MRVILLLVILAARAEADPLWFAARIGGHHTHISKDDGEPDGRGPRFEVALEKPVRRVVVLSAVLALSTYHSDNLYDPQLFQTYEVRMQDTWLGARVLFRPLPYVFAGMGVLRLASHERVRSENMSWGPTLTYEPAVMTEFSVGLAVPITKRVVVEAMATTAKGKYSHDAVSSRSIMLGVRVR